MQTLTNQRIQHALALFLFLFLTPAAFAQPQRDGCFECGIRVNLRAVPVVVPVKQQRAVDQRVKPGGKGGTPFTRTTGALTVVSEPLATIFLRPVGATKDIDKEELPADKSQAIFASLKPGKYKVVAELDGYDDGEREVMVLANHIQPLELHLREKLYTVTVKTTVPTGDVKYRLSKGGATPQFVRITNGKAAIRDLHVGKYEVDIKADDAAYETILATIDVGEGQTEFEVELKYALCEQIFSESWVSLSTWEAPAAWRAAGRKLHLNGAGLAMPKDDCPRHFADFELTTDVKLLNEQGIAFIARARDAKNYYLIQLTGARAAEPFLLRGFAYVNGAPQPLGRGIPLDAFALNMKGKYFTVVLKAKGNVFELFINDSDTGDELPLGKLTDPSKHFALGAIGLAGSGNEQTEVARFIVRPIKR